MSVKDVHVDQVLTDYFGGMTLGVLGADALAPRKPVKKKSDSYKYVQKGDVLRAVEDRVADKTESNWLKLATGEASYLCIKHALQARISDDERDNADIQTQLEQGSIDPIAMVLAMNRERDAVTLRNTCVGTAARSVLWNAAAGTKIQEDIATGMASVMAGTGGMFAPNRMIVPFSVAQAMGGAAELAQTMALVFASVIKSGFLPPAWRGMDVVVPTAYGNTAAKGQADVLAELWGDDVFIGYCAAHPFGFATTFTWHQRVNRFRKEEIHCDVFEPEDSRDARVTNNGAGYLITACLT